MSARANHIRDQVRIGHRRLWAWCREVARRRRADERGEGVISMAIAVLIMAGIGALMWVGFKVIWEDTETNTKDKVAEIGE
jgi:hypothetical protein